MNIKELILSKDLIIDDLKQCWCRKCGYGLGKVNVREKELHIEMYCPKCGTLNKLK